MPKKPVFIYCLKCPRTGDVRYIGQTNDLKRRLKEHLKRSIKTRCRLGNWIKSLNGENPVLAVLHEVAEHESWAEEERRYISCARAMGVELVNTTEGGEGFPGLVRTPEHCAAISAAHKGVPNSPEHCASLSAVWTPERRAAKSAAQKGVPLSPERCAAMSAAWTPERRAAFGAAVSARQKGVPRGPYSPEYCAAIGAGLKASPVFAAYVAGKVGVPLIESHRAAVGDGNRGKKRTAAQKAALSAIHTGLPWSPARRAAFERGKLAKSSAK